jgi:hypothetical protein
MVHDQATQDDERSKNRAREHGRDIDAKNRTEARGREERPPPPPENAPTPDEGPTSEIEGGPATGSAALTAAAVLGAVDTLNTVIQLVKADRPGAAVATIAESAAVYKGLANPVTAAPTAAYLEARTYWAHKHEIDAAAERYGELFEPGPGHSVLGANKAAEFAVVAGAAYTVRDAARSVGRGAALLSGAFNKPRWFMPEARTVPVSPLIDRFLAAGRAR